MKIESFSLNLLRVIREKWAGDSPGCEAQTLNLSRVIRVSGHVIHLDVKPEPYLFSISKI